MTTGARRDVPQKQDGWARMQVAYERSRALLFAAADDATVDPSEEQLAQAWAATFNTDGDRARGGGHRRAGVRRAGDAAAPRPRAHVPGRPARFADAALERRGLPGAPGAGPAVLMAD